MVQAPVAVRAHDDEIGRPAQCIFHDGVRYPPRVFLHQGRFRFETGIQGNLPCRLERFLARTLERIDDVAEGDETFQREADGRFVDHEHEADSRRLIAGEPDRLADAEQRAGTAVDGDEDALVGGHAADESRLSFARTNDYALAGRIFHPAHGARPPRAGGRTARHTRVRPMQRYYPRSFLMLTVVGFMLVALPLLLGLANSALSVGQVANQSRKAVHQAVQAAQASRILIEQVTVMERRFRQFMILGDDSLLEGFEVAHDKFRTEAQALEALVPDTARRDLIADLTRAEQALHERVLGSRGNPQTLRDAVGEFTPLADLARTIEQQGSEVVDREVRSLQEKAEEVRQLVIWQLLGLVPVVIFLVVGFTALIAKPIRQIEGAILQLGKADFNTEISVDGPADLEYLGRRLDWMRQRLLELEDQKARLLRHVSHELKTPLTALKEGAQLLAEGAVGPLSEEQREVVEILRVNGVELQRLIEDLLAYQALQAGKSSLNLTRFELRPALEEVAWKQELALRGRGLHLDLVCPVIMIEGDERRIATIFDNLLSNAIKFSPDGQTIRVIATQSGDRVVIEVRDAGPGLAEEEREKVFDAFFRGRRAPHQRIKGSGLGLSIVKEYVSAHGGSVEARNTESGGACFRVNLPRVARNVPELSSTSVSVA